MREAVARMRVQRAREEQDNALAKLLGHHKLRREQYELRRDRVVESLEIGLAVVLVIGIAISLGLRPDLIPGTALCGTMLSICRSLLRAASRRRE